VKKLKAAFGSSSFCPYAFVIRLVALRIPPPRPTMKRLKKQAEVKISSFWARRHVQKPIYADSSTRNPMFKLTHSPHALIQDSAYLFAMIAPAVCTAIKVPIS